jgi:hypothetical protein
MRQILEKTGNTIGEQREIATSKTRGSKQVLVKGERDTVV